MTLFHVIIEDELVKISEEGIDKLITKEQMKR